MQYLCGEKKPKNRGMILLSKRQHWLKSFDLLQCVYLDYVSHYLMPVLQPFMRSPSCCRLWAKERQVGQAPGQGWEPTAPVPSCPLWGFGAGPGAPSAWGAARCWIPTQLLIAVVQPWFRGILVSPLLCWASSSSPSQSLAPSCTCWYLHSSPKFRKNWISS